MCKQNAVAERLGENSAVITVTCETHGNPQELRFTDVREALAEGALYASLGVIPQGVFSAVVDSLVAAGFESANEYRIQ